MLVFKLENAKVLEYLVASNLEQKLKQWKLQIQKKGKKINEKDQKIKLSSKDYKKDTCELI